MVFFFNFKLYMYFMKIYNHNFSIILVNLLFLIFITSCVNRNVIKVDDDIRKINLIDNKGLIIKTYFEKYSHKYGGWLRAKCSEKIESKNCKFSSSSLSLINNLKYNNNTVEAKKSNEMNETSNEEQENDKEFEKEEENEEENFEEFENLPE